MMAYKRHCIVAGKPSVSADKHPYNFSYSQYEHEDDAKGNSKRVDPNFIAGMLLLPPLYIIFAVLLCNFSNLLLPYRQEISI